MFRNPVFRHRHRSGLASVEFSLVSFFLVLFLVGIVAMGAMAVSLYSLKQATSAAASYAVTAFSATLAGSATPTVPTSLDCPPNASVQAAFDQAAEPIFGAANPPPAISLAWWGSLQSICGGTASTGSAPGGGGATVTATFAWGPVGLAWVFGASGLTLSASQSESATGAPSS